LTKRRSKLGTLRLVSMVRQHCHSTRCVFQVWQVLTQFITYVHYFCVSWSLVTSWFVIVNLLEVLALENHLATRYSLLRSVQSAQCGMQAMGWISQICTPSALDITMAVSPDVRMQSESEPLAVTWSLDSGQSNWNLVKAAVGIPPPLSAHLGLFCPFSVN